MTSQEFEDKFMRLAPHLYQVAFSMLQNPQDAEDVVQETFVKLWRDRQRLEAFENAEGYAMRMLRNACIDCLRLRQEETELVTYEERLANPEPPPRMNDEQKVNFILQHLPPKIRQIITMRHVSECSIDEICEVTGETPSNVRQILSRTRRKIVEQFKTFIS
jgi:RNA polymerase sigma-70 factor (ECF subfamily)